MSQQIASNKMSVRIAKLAMRLRPQDPHTGLDPVDVKYIKDFYNGDSVTRERALVEMAELRYQAERDVPFSSYFGRIDLRRFLTDRDVLEFGSASGGMTRSIIETFEPRSTTGLDIDANTTESARRYFKKLELAAEFVRYEGRELPFANGSFDTVYSFDVFNVVSDLDLSVGECFRVLRPGGHLLTAFQGFYHPKSHYLFLVTGTPCIHYFFSRETLSQAYEELLDERGEAAKWYRPEKRGLEPWQRTFNNNGVTKAGFRHLARSSGFEIEHDYPLALGETGRTRLRMPVLGAVVPFVRLLARAPIMEEALCHRIVMVLRKPLSPLPSAA
jgi:SAM-dependent methyltransferase